MLEDYRQVELIRNLCPEVFAHESEMKINHKGNFLTGL